MDRAKESSVLRIAWGDLCCWRRDGFLLQFQSALEEVFDDWAEVFQVRVDGEAFEVADIGLGEGAGKMGVAFKCGDVHKVWLNARADLFTKLGKDVEAAVIHI